MSPRAARRRAADPQDPPIYREMVALWSDRGRTLPGRPDPEWARLAAPTVRGEGVSGTPVPRGAGR
ncbi:hypothetical protein [Streptomyces sp. SID5785]|uniref:hypothetical protein n=1 Tax=Streptomyces sp. SID5785 TaxID=2690309 RepID=UPI001F328CFD|nr:hypothetical protein [Streptomyces sp. SID5785]